MTDDSQSNTGLPATVLRVRADLQYESIKRGGHSVHLVKDPVRLQYFELDEHEFALLQRLDGHTAPNEIIRWFNRRYPPLQLTTAAFHQLVQRLQQQGLVVSTAAGQGSRDAARRSTDWHRNLVNRLTNPWAIRLPGVAPGNCPALWNLCFGWIFAPWFVLLVLAALLGVIGLAVSRARDFLAMSPDASQILARDNMILLAVVLIVVKLLHEMGHAVAAYRQGAACHEIGVLLLAGMPTLFCDVSDAWMLPGRWQRILVSLAGIWVELLLAMLAFWAWINSVPGIVHELSFNVMLVCSISTILFNANPLVRYDGYYVLMDLTGVSNLGQKSQQAVQRLVDRLIFGSRAILPLDVAEPPRWTLIYGLASSVYQIGLTCAIFWGLHHALKPYAASVLVWMAASITFAFWGVSMIRSSRGRLRQMTNSGTPGWRIACGYAVIGGCLAAFACVPLPWFIIGDAVLEPAVRQSLVSTVAGEPVIQRPAGSLISSGDPICQLQNREMEQELQQLMHDVSEQRRKVNTLKARRNHDRRTAEQLPAAGMELAGLEHRLKYLQQEQQRLKLQAAVSGQFYAAPYRLDDTSAAELPGWTGSLLDPANQDAWIAAGDEVGQIGDLRQFEATAILSQDDLELVSVGQFADVWLTATGTTVRGEVIRISRVKLEDRQPLNTDQRFPGQPVTFRQSNWYQIQIRCLEFCPDTLRVRTRGKVRIHLGTRTVGQFLVDQFLRTFRWHS